MLVSEYLCATRDPYLRRKLSSFKQNIKGAKEPSFMQRMQKDSNDRRIIDQVIDQKYGVQELKETAKNSQVFGTQEEEEKAFYEVFDKVNNLPDRSHWDPGAVKVQRLIQHQEYADLTPKPRSLIEKAAGRNLTKMVMLTTEINNKQH